jgi:hypothetical protein
VRPDALVEVRRRSAEGIRIFSIEYDRTRRVDKNFQKFRRYDALLCWWWRQSELARHDEPPYIIFICQDEPQRDTFLRVADRELTGHLWHPSDRPEEHRYQGRDNILFAAEADIHRGETASWRVPAFPPRHPSRPLNESIRGVHLPGDHVNRTKAALRAV